MPMLAFRAFIFLLGISSVSYASICLPVFVGQNALRSASAVVISGVAISPDLLIRAAEKDRNDWILNRPATLAAAAIVDMRLLEEVMTSDPGSVQGRMKSLTAKVRESLASSPMDPFLWNALFWLKSSEGGFQPKAFEYLRMSYLVGENEGWVAVRRNRLAVGRYMSLPADLSEKAAGEFGRLVRSNFFDEAADILSGPGWPVRTSLLQQLEGLDALHRRTFSIILSKKASIVLPGTDPADRRPWN